MGLHVVWILSVLTLGPLNPTEVQRYVLSTHEICTQRREEVLEFLAKEELRGYRVSDCIKEPVF